MKKLFQQHLKQRLNEVSQVLEVNNVDTLFIESGFPDYYFYDDQHVFFKSNPHFLFFCPDAGSGHVLKIKPGKKPELSFYIPNDFWHETSSLKSDFWEDEFNIKVISDFEKNWETLKETSGKHVVISPTPEVALSHNCELPSENLISQLHWLRIQKTDYEIECIKKANEIASLGHIAAKKSFFSGDSEFEVYQQYLEASNQKQAKLPYESIVAFNEKAAVLHYQNTRTLKNGNTFLIDAGARFNGYCSDITRTYFQKNVSQTFKDLHKAINEIQQRLCLMVKPGLDYVKIQEQTHQEMAQLLLDLKILNGQRDDILSNEVLHSFFPHGIGHGLGIQVHDVGGKQLSSSSTQKETSSDHPYLRTLREIQMNDVLTIEPGIYFIPILLEKLRKDSKLNSFVNWSLIEELIPLGGIRIEDNVVASADGPINLTRPFLPN